MLKLLEGFGAVVFTFLPDTWVYPGRITSLGPGSSKAPFNSSSNTTRIIVQRTGTMESIENYGNHVKVWTKTYALLRCPIYLTV